MKNKNTITALVLLLSFISTPYAYAISLDLDSSARIIKEEDRGNEDEGLEVIVEEETSVSTGTDETDYAYPTGTSTEEGGSILDINSESDVKFFTESLIENDPNLSSIQISNDTESNQSIKVSYKHKAKLLGFIPIYIKSQNKVEVDSSNSLQVSSKLPWWSFLVKSTNYNKTDIESRIKSSPSVQALTQTKVSTEVKADIAKAIVLEIAASVE